MFHSTRCMPVSLTRVLFTFYSCPSLLLQHLLCSSSRDRDGKSAKDEKGKNYYSTVLSMSQLREALFPHSVQLDTVSFFIFFFYISIPNNCHVFWKSGVAGSNNSSSRNIWVSGLSSNTKAADLKNLFGKYGKVNNTCSSPGFSCCAAARKLGGC